MKTFQRSVIALALAGATMTGNAQPGVNMYWNNWYMNDAIWLQFGSAPDPAVVLDDCPAYNAFHYSFSDPLNGQVVLSAPYSTGELLNRFGSLIHLIAAPDQLLAIIPHPGERYLYLLFYVEAATNDVRTGVIDVAANGGLGSVTIDDDALTSMTGKLYLGPLSDQAGLNNWAIFHGDSTNDFFLFRVHAATGLDPTPLVIPYGPVAVPNALFKGPFNVDGRCIALPNNERIAILRNDGPGLPLKLNFLAFDQTALAFTGNVEISADGLGRTACVSPNSQVLYTGAVSSLDSGQWMQYDLSSWDPATILSSAYALNPPGQPTASDVDGMQLAPNGKIYSAIVGGGMDSTACQYLGSCMPVIHQPDVLGAGCLFDAPGLDLQRPNLMALTPKMPLVDCWYSAPISILNELTPQPVFGVPAWLPLLISPNPGAGPVTFSLPSGSRFTGAGSLRIADAAGRQVHAAPWRAGVTSSVLDLSALDQGIYVVQLTGRSDQRYQGRLVVTH